MLVDKSSRMQDKAACLILALMLISLSAVSYVPSPDQVSLFVFLIAYLVFGSYAFFASRWWTKIKIHKPFLLIVLLGVVVANLFISQINDISFEKWVRSFVPIAFFITFLWAPFYIRVVGVRRTCTLVLFSCFTFCFFLVVFNISKFLAYFQGGGRLTFYLQDSVVPYPFVGVILAALMPGIGLVKRGLYIAFFLIFVMAVGYKLQIIFLLGFFLFQSFIYPGVLRRIFLCCMFLLGLSIIFMVAGDYVEQRLSSMGGGGDEVRLLEIKYALNIFTSSPILGGGLGLDVPLEQTRPAYKEIGYLWESDSVSYIHNFPFYLLMVGGLSFAVPFMMLVNRTGILRVKKFWTSDGYVKMSVWVSLGVLIFFTTSAAFKQIQCVVVLVFFVSLYQALNEKRLMAHE